jgi:hypothetical protein
MQFSRNAMSRSEGPASFEALMGVNLLMAERTTFAVLGVEPWGVEGALEGMVAVRWK